MNIILTIVLALFAVSIALIAFTVARHNKSLDRLEELDMKMVASLTTHNTDLNKRIDNVTTIHNATVEHYDAEIDQIIERMERITADIARLDQTSKKDHADLVDIRERYILWREPAQPNGGVEWASEFPTQEEEHGEIESD